jgi:hypothetical protein
MNAHFPVPAAVLLANAHRGAHYTHTERLQEPRRLGCSGKGTLLERFEGIVAVFLEIQVFGMCCLRGLFYSVDIVAAILPNV